MSLAGFDLLKSLTQHLGLLHHDLFDRFMRLIYIIDQACKCCSLFYMLESKCYQNVQCLEKYLIISGNHLYFFLFSVCFYTTGAQKVCRERKFSTLSKTLNKNKILHTQMFCKIITMVLYFIVDCFIDSCWFVLYLNVMRTLQSVIMIFTFILWPLAEY